MVVQCMDGGDCPDVCVYPIMIYPLQNTEIGSIPCVRWHRHAQQHSSVCEVASMADGLFPRLKKVLKEARQADTW